MSYPLWTCLFSHGSGDHRLSDPTENCLYLQKLNSMLICNCVAPEHLILGTRSQNMRDAVERGRHGTAKLVRSQVNEIRARYALGGTTHAALAKEHGVCTATVSHILSGRNWRPAS